jgi:hypothetical protein
MVPERDVIVPPQVRQGQLVDEIGICIASVVEGRWSTLIFNHRNLCEFFTGRIQVHRPGGIREHVRPPEAAFPLTDELRRIMYQPGRGTWFSARWSITSAGGSDAGVSAQVAFNYDDEPVWRWPAHPGLYAIDLEMFPRDEECIPGWLRQKVNDARSSL